VLLEGEQMMVGDVIIGPSHHWRVSDPRPIDRDALNRWTFRAESLGPHGLPRVLPSLASAGRILLCKTRKGGVLRITVETASIFASIDDSWRPRHRRY
jgi:hypothetical protein